uniref:E3 ubiquitin-protein ligase MIB2 n=1 Tax=Pan troglodytes TaxID=9598 RepID=A0A2I3SND2_PANTR
MAAALRRGRALGSRPSGPTVSSRRSPQCPVAQEGLRARSRPRVAPRSLARCGPSSRLMGWKPSEARGQSQSLQASGLQPRSLKAARRATGRPDRSRAARPTMDPSAHRSRAAPPNMDPDPQAGVQVGMRVVRGVDWKWGQQDGGEGGVGTVVELGRHGSPSTPDRTVVVQWDQGTRTNYRAGYQGAHDLLLYDNAQIGVRHPNIICDCCKKHGLRGMRWKCRVCLDYDLCTQCYMHNKHELAHAFDRYETAHSRPVTLSPRQGLPRIPLRGIFQGAKVVRGPDWEWGSQDGKPAELQRRVSADSQPFQHGDKVKCLLDTDVLREMQEGHGGWNPRMAEFIGQTGTVHRITDRGDVRVQFNHETRWTFHPGALTKHHSFWVGDVVRVIGDLDTVKRLQAGHGEWTDDMAPALGRVGKVVKVFGDGNLRVAVAGQRWTFSPSCLVAYRPEEDANLDVAERARENKSSLSVALDKLRAQKSDPEHPGRLVVEVALGNAARALDLLRRRPEQVDTKNQGRTALQVAAYLGQVELIRLLLQARAGVDLPDDEGNTALHYAQDAHSDTPLHSAISAGTGASGIVEVLTEVPNIDVTATNSQGFTLLHHASLKGHALAVRKILARARQLVDAKKEDGFTALHLAALNNHREVAQILIREGRCDVNVRNRKLQSPLHLAVQQAHVGLVPLLVDAGCSVNAEDEEGDTALHVALQHHQLLPLVADGAGGDPGPLQLLSRLQASGLPGSAELTVGAAVACFLALEGADVSYTNHRGRSPLDLAAEGRVLKALQGCAQRFQERQAGGGAAPGPRQTLGTPNTVTNLHVGAAPGPEAAECLVCSELALLVLFSPCQHRTVCEECARRMKKCIRCQVVVSKKLRPDGSEVASAAPAPGPPRQLVEELQSRYRQMEERITCPICIDSHIRLVFQCGHGACAPCGSALSACPICRQPIRDRIQIFV